MRPNPAFERDAAKARYLSTLRYVQNTDMKFKYFFLSGFIFLSGCGEPVSQSQAMLAEDIKCPEGSLPEIQRWGGMGENGWLHACVMKHGLFTAWRGEAKVIEGSYNNGQKEGVWQFRDREGKKYKEVTYEKGKETSEKNFD